MKTTIKLIAALLFYAGFIALTVAAYRVGLATFGMMLVLDGFLLAGQVLIAEKEAKKEAEKEGDGNG